MNFAQQRSLWPLPRRIFGRRWQLLLTPPTRLLLLGAAAKSPLPREIAENLYAASEQRGSISRLDGEFVRPGAGAERHMQRSEIMDDLVLVLPWHEVSSFHFRAPAHVNLQEGRALKNDVRRETMMDGATRRIFIFLMPRGCAGP